MMNSYVARTAALGLILGVVTGCAVLPNADPRNPAPVKDGPVVLRVCYIDGDGAHLVVGDRVELTTNTLGRLRIRHLPENNRPAWNGGDDIAVRDAVLVEQIMSSGEGKNTRRFVPVGQFSVQLPDSSHVKFDFLTSKAVANQCDVPPGTDTVIIRGVEDKARHGGHAILLE